MSGEFSLANVEAAARAGALQAGALRRIEDAFAPDPLMGMTLGELQAQFAEAGHKVGGGYDDCAVCQKMAQDLPAMLMQVQQMAAQEQGAPPQNGFQ